MSHKSAFEVLDRTLKDIRGNDDLIGVTILLAGDFGRTLPVVLDKQIGTRAGETKACLKSSSIWHKVKNFTLSTNTVTFQLETLPIIGLNLEMEQFHAIEMETSHFQQTISILSKALTN